MDSIVFNVQLVIGIAVYGLLGKWFVIPRLDRMPREQALVLCLIPQLFRQVGLYALVPGTYQQFPESWAQVTAYGDLSTQLTSLAAAILLRRGSPAAIPVVWLSAAIGVTGAAVAMYLMSATAVPLHELYSAWFLPVFFLPAILWSHIYTIRFLLRKRA